MKEVSHSRFEFMSGCRLCPVECGANRTKTRGACGADDKIRIGYAGAHFGEEPPLVGSRGSGTIFFSGCSLRCVFCQNAAISADCGGKIYSESALKTAILNLSETCENVNLVTAGHMLDLILPVLERVKPRLTVPVIYNSGGYETVASLKRLKGIVDVFLPDYKYFSPEIAERYSGRKDYPELARKAIEEMVEQQSEISIDNGLIRRGVLVRHLVLPGCRQDSIAVVRDIAARWKNNILVSVMSQYTPEFNRSSYSELNRRITSFEYDSVLAEAERLGLNGFMQEKGSATSELTPKWKL